MFFQKVCHFDEKCDKSQKKVRIMTIKRDNLLVFFLITS